ncbi:hypothetical protein [Streptomyces griseofuscus]|nr:hypothetical protein [Streptomyces sp. SID4946]
MSTSPGHMPVRGLLRTSPPQLPYSPRPPRDPYAHRGGGRGCAA